MYVTFERADQTAANIKTFWFKPARAVRYTAGEFIEMYLPHDNADNRGQKRWFTLSSSPTDELVSITTKFAAERGSSFKQALAALQPGAQVMLADPMGDFILPKDQSRPVVCVAGGIGVTPMHSMIKWLTDTGERRDICLIYSVGRPEELAFASLFESYCGEKFMAITKEADPEWQGHVGSLDAARILEFSGTPANALYYLSGPEGMIQAFVKGLRASGISKHDIVTDYFPGYPA
jgi:glycine betaine catabolism B